MAGVEDQKPFVEWSVDLNGPFMRLSSLQDVEGYYSQPAKITLVMRSNSEFSDYQGSPVQPSWFTRMQNGENLWYRVHSSPFDGNTFDLHQMRLDGPYQNPSKGNDPFRITLVESDDGTSSKRKQVYKNIADHPNYDANKQEILEFKQQGHSWKQMKEKFEGRQGSTTNTIKRYAKETGQKWTSG